MHEFIIDKFLDKLTNYARNIKIGDSLKLTNPGTMGPVVSKEHYNKIKSFIQVACDLGHEIVCGETIEYFI